MTNEQLSQIEQRASAASPGPWTVTTAETDCGRACTPNGCCGHDSGLSENIDGPSPDLGYSDRDVFEHAIGENDKLKPHWDEDFEFIAHARQDIPDLIAEVRRLRGLNNRLASMVKIG